MEEGPLLIERLPVELMAMPEAWPPRAPGAAAAVRLRQQRRIVLEGPIENIKARHGATLERNRARLRRGRSRNTKVATILRRVKTRSAFRMQHSSADMKARFARPRPAQKCLRCALGDMNVGSL